MSAEEEQSELIQKGVLQVVLQADTSYLLWGRIAEHAGPIHKAGFGPFFWAVQGSLVDQFVLALTKLFEKQKRHPLRSLPAIGDFIRERSRELQFRDRPFILAQLREAGVAVPQGADDRTLTGLLLEHFDRRLPFKDGGDDPRWEQLQSLKERRDKVIAHNECIGRDEVATGTWKEALELLDIARDLVHLAARGYLNLHCKIGPEYLLGRDARRVQTCLTRLLRKAGLAVDSARQVKGRT